MGKWADNQNKYVKNWKKSHPEACKKHAHDRNKRMTLMRKEFLMNIRNAGNCVKCGYKEHPEILEFHHRNPKEKEINICCVRDLKSIKKEVKKCDLICPNCHRWFHSYKA